MEFEGNSVSGKIIAGIALAGSAFGLVGCSPQASEYRNADTTGKISINLTNVTDHGNGVYEFPANDEFPQTLAKFREEHRDLTIISVTQGADHRSSWRRDAVSSAHSFIVVTDSVARPR